MDVNVLHAISPVCGFMSRCIKNLHYTKHFEKKMLMSHHTHQPFHLATSPNRQHTHLAQGIGLYLLCPLPLTKCHYAFHHRINSSLFHQEFVLMKSRSSAELCQNAKIPHPCTTLTASITLWKSMKRRNSQ